MHHLASSMATGIEQCLGISQSKTKLEARIFAIMPNAKLTYSEDRLSVELKADQVEEFARLYEAARVQPGGTSPNFC